MRVVALVVVLLSVALATDAPVRAQSTEPPVLGAMRVAKVDLEAALSYQEMAIASTKNRDDTKARHQLVDARGALLHMETAVAQLAPEEYWTGLFTQVNRKPEPWATFEHDVTALAADNTSALERGGSGLDRILERSNAKMRELIDYLSKAIRDRCAELVDLRGPIEVNGVPQGHSELTVSVSCRDGINLLELGIDNVVWTHADAGSNASEIVAGGRMLEVDGHGATSVTVTAEANPDPAAGERLEGDIIPLAGDSAPPIDETM